MRRPLALCCMLFACVLLFLLQANPIWWEPKEVLPEDTLSVKGTIVEKQYQEQGEGWSLVLHLSPCQLFQSHGTVETESTLVCYLAPRFTTIGELVEYEQRLGDAIAIGRKIHLSGTLHSFRRATNPGQFDQKKYYQILGIGASMYEGKLLGTSSQPLREIPKLQEKLYQLRRSCALMFYGTMPKREASIMCSLLLGQKKLLEQDAKEVYQQSGILHILSISALHISLLGMGLYRLLEKLSVPRIPCACLSVLFVLLYGMLIGFGPSAFRAICMFFLQMLAKGIGRTYDLLTGLAFAGLMLLLFQPLYLYHSGFLLSFASVLSLAILVPALETLFPRKLQNGVAILLGTMPVQALFYYQISPYSLLINLLAVPLAGVLLVVGIGCLLLGSISLSLATGVGNLVVLLLKGLYALAAWSLHLPGKQWVIGMPEAWQIMLYLLLLLLILVWQQGMPKLWKYLGLCLAIGLLTRNWQVGLQVTFLDVGQGDAIYMTDNRDTHILMDGGSSSVSQVGTYRLLPFLKAEGVSSLDAVFLSHLDEDHCNGIIELLQQAKDPKKGGITIDTLYLVGQAGEVEKLWDSQEESLQILLQAAKEGQVEVRILQAGALYQKGKLSLTCLYPKEADLAATRQEAERYDNAHSMVLLLEYPGVELLLTGDLEDAGERALVGSLTLKNQGLEENDYNGQEMIRILKVAHHGSKHSTKEEMLWAYRPDIAVISVGKGNVYGHPHEETLQRLTEAGATILRTDEQGAVTLSLGKW